MSDLVAIKAQNVKKDFVLPHEKTSSIKSGIVGIFRKNKSREVQHALKGVSFGVNDGEFFGILGRNGSGKSTLLKMLSGIYQPTSGRIDIKGKLVPFIELGVGFNPELTGRENVYLNGALLGFSKKEIDERYDEIVEFAELERFMDQKLKNYSSGMQVRLAFSVATRAEADVLLVDEVLAVGDADFQRKCYDFFKSLKKSGKTVVFVTHDMAAVKEYCDKAILVDNGRIISSGDANDVANDYLKLFNKSSDGLESQDSNHWGTGAVKINEVKASVEGESIIITTDIQCSKTLIDDLVVGIKIVDSSGAIVAGANTINVINGAQKTIKIKPESTVRLAFESNNILGTGSYAIHVTARSSDRVTIYDNWDYATRLSVTKDESYYPIVLPADLTVK